MADTETGIEQAGQLREPKNSHIMLRCPRCDQQYEAEIGNNPLVKDGLTITPLPIEIPIESEIAS